MSQPPSTETVRVTLALVQKVDQLTGREHRNEFFNAAVAEKFQRIRAEKEAA